MQARQISVVWQHKSTVFVFLYILRGHVLAKRFIPRWSFRHQRCRTDGAVDTVYLEDWHRGTILN